MSTHDTEEFRSHPGATLPDGTPEPAVHPLVRFSVRNYVFSIGIFVMLVLAGLVTTFRLGVELLPNFEVPVLAVSTAYPGANPDQVDREVSRKIEDAVSTLAGVTDINTTSVSNQSAVVITFNDGTDVDSAANSVSQAVAAIRGALPDGSEAPVVQKFDPNATPILTLALLGAGAPPDEVTTYAEDVLVPRLERVDGVADVSVSGGPARKVQVLLDPSRLQAYNLTPARITQAIGASALDLPAGTVAQGGVQTQFSTRNTPRSAADVARITVDTQTGVQVSDVASVRDGAAEATSLARVNGQPAVLLSVRKGSGTNSVRVTDAVREAMQAQPLPKGYSITLASDTTRETRATVKDTFKEFLIAIAAVGVIVLLFLGRLDTVFAVILAIPISISAAPLLFGVTGFTFNIISLLAIIVAIGIVVDDSIVVAENVQRYRALGYSRLRSVLLGGSEVFSAVTAASFSLLAVLIPLSLMPGILGQFFSQFGLGIAAAIVLSWLESLLFLTVRMAYTRDLEPVTWADVPRVIRRFPALLRGALVGVKTVKGVAWLAATGALVSVLLTRVPLPVPVAVLIAVVTAPLVLAALRYVITSVVAVLEAVTDTLHGITNRAVQAVARAYARGLSRALARPWAVMVVALAFLLSAPLALRGVGFAFTPKSDSGIVTVDLSLPVGTDLDATNRLTRRLEDALLARPEVRLLETSVGASGQIGGANANESGLTATLVNKGERAPIDELIAEYTRDLTPLVAGVPGAELRVGTQQQGPAGNSDISLALAAPNQAVLLERNRQIVQLLSRDPKLRTVESSLSATRQERTFVPDATKLAGTGLSANDVAQALRTYNDGTTAGSVRDGDRSIDIVVRLDPSRIADEQSLLSQTVYSPALNANLSLGQLGSFSVSQAPATLTRLNKAYTATLNINVVRGGPNAFAYQRELIQRVQDAGLLQGGVTLGNASAFGSAGLTSDLVFYGPVLMVVAVLLTYLVLGSQFNSFRYPIYLLLPIPLAIVGALWTLHLFGVNLDVITVLGMVILLGLSTKNSILYLEFVTERARTLPLREALLEAAELRFRPILMTTLTVLVISIPLILGQGDGAEFRRGLGIVILGGVITSTLLTFFVVPSVFWQFERRRVKPEPQPPAPAGTLAPGD
ncbi:HAE1 family hydrophobic/amphiphilic exporter-1 [Deinococcus metalli]|uniref:HAE1 family hydrophobic/amphiphilic exporter-1 n=1 Tax=Deinococcus metalli TaxID=1141878 RepID=A0A7W8NR46_9DEIO|nr:efflux RND transporter permease subunit [Deinococcus metalli]MBB5375757.1 HAE1 family hydrophobic/amphiphilic exporter-1 [Deinococcus metalli]GHF37284.1 multidrug transporter [Deinococcus metalli]